MRRTKAAASETRNQLLDAAERVFVERGLAAATLSDIACAARVTRGAIYWHFDNKADLATSVLDRVALQLEMLIKTALNANKSDPLGRIREVLVALLLDVARNPRRWRVLNVIFTKCELVDEHYPALARYYRIGTYRHRKRLQAALRGAIGNGQLPRDLDLKFATTLLLTSCTGLLREWFFDPIAITLDKDAERIADSWLGVLRYHSTCLAKSQAFKGSSEQ